MAKHEDITADLSESELAEIERRAAIRAVVVHEAIRKEGEAELSRSSSGLAWSGLAAAETARVAVIVILTYLVGLGELSHIIAGSVETFYLVGTGQLSFGTYLVSYMIPTLLGNIVGGVSMAAALNHAQVVAGET